MWQQLTDNSGTWIDGEYISDGMCAECECQFKENDYMIALALPADSLHDLDVTMYVKPGRDCPKEICPRCTRRALRLALPPQTQLNQLVREFGIPRALAEPVTPELSEQTLAIVESIKAFQNRRHVLVQHSVRNAGAAQMAAIEYVRQQYYAGACGITATALRSVSMDMVQEDLSLVIYDFHAPQGSTINETKLAEYKVETFIIQRFLKLQRASTLLFTHMNDEQLAASFPNAYWILNERFTILEL